MGDPRGHPQLVCEDRLTNVPCVADCIALFQLKHSLRQGKRSFCSAACASVHFLFAFTRLLGHSLNFEREKVEMTVVVIL